MTMERPLPDEVADEAGAPEPIAPEPFYPHHLIRQGIQILVVFAVITVLATLYPAPMGPPADPTQMPETVAPEWVFLAAHHVLEMAKLLPVAPQVQQTIGVSVVVVGFLVVLLVPFIDRRAERRPRKRLLAMALLALAIVAYTALTLWPYWKRYVL
ncbi:MAG: hypothetical protein ACE5KY_00270 [Candidatus Tectimicrobiota bacterium]